MEEQFDPTNPHFVDAEGNDVHVGDFVSWVNHQANCDRLKVGRVLGISYSRESASGIKCMVKVRGKSNNAPAATFTLIEGDTLVGKLRRLVAACEGTINDEAIGGTAADIEAMFAPEEGHDGE